MRILTLFLLSLPMMAQSGNVVIVMPYKPVLLKWIQGDDVQRERMVPIVTPRTCTNPLTGTTYDCPVTTYELRTVTEFDRVKTPMDLHFGDPAIELEGVTGRRMAFSHAMTETDEVTGLRRDADLTWLAKRLLTIARNQDICLAGDTNAQCLLQIKAYVTIRRDETLPANWRYPVTQ
jgi:hypothetical protein